MATLYDLTCDLQALLDAAEDPDISEDTLQCVLDTTEAVQMELSDKADGYAKVMRQMQADADAIENEILRLNKRKEHILKNADRMKAALRKSMEATGQDKIKTNLFTFTIRRSAPHVVVDTAEDHHFETSSIPKEYWKAQEPRLDRLTLAKDLKEGKEIKGAHLEVGKSLVIR